MPTESRRYSYAEQARHYRESARDRGCTCPDLPPHVHLPECPFVESFTLTVPTPGDTVSIEYERDPNMTPIVYSSPAADVPSDGASPPPSPPRDGPDGQGETTPGGVTHPSPGAGDLAFIEGSCPFCSFTDWHPHSAHLVEAYIREEDHAEERHWERP